MNWASTPSMGEGWMSPGGSSQARQYTPRTLMPMVCGVLCLKPPKSGPQNGAPPRRAPVVSTRPLEALHLLFRNVRYWHFSDIQPALTNVRFWGQSGRLPTAAYQSRNKLPTSSTIRHRSFLADSDPSASAGGKGVGRAEIHGWH